MVAEKGRSEVGHRNGSALADSRVGDMQDMLV